MAKTYQVKRLPRSVGAYTYGVYGPGCVPYLPSVSELNAAVLAEWMDKAYAEGKRAGLREWKRDNAELLAVARELYDYHSVKETEADAADYPDCAEFHRAWREKLGAAIAKAKGGGQ